MDFTPGLLEESKTIRDQSITQLRSQANEEQVLNKVKALMCAVWRGKSRVTRRRVAEFYEVQVATIDKNYKRHKKEFELDGVEVLRGMALNDARDILSLASTSSQETIYTAAGVLRMGFILRDSEVAKEVRSMTIQIIQGTGKQLDNKIVRQNPDSRLAEDLMLADYAARAAQNAGVDKNITEQIKLEALMKMYPEREKLLKPQKEAIAASNPMPEKPMTATEVAQQLGLRLGYPKISARKVNNKLLQLGYQTSVTRVKRSTGKEVHDFYQATEKGKPHSTLLLSLYVEGEGKATKAQLRWFESIISILAHNWEDNN